MVPEQLVAGGRGHPRAEVLPPGRRAARSRSASPRTACPSGCSAARRPTGDPRDRQRDGQPAGVPPAGRAAGRTGAGRAATSRSEADARAFYDEICHMLAAQMAAPNSPQWFNTGLHWAYGIDGPPQGHYCVDPATGEVTRSTSAYEHPAPHACFIQRVNDDLVNDGGIMDLWVREARIFKYGSGHRHQLLRPARRGRAALRRRQVVSGLMSFLKIGDRAAGAIKSGGTTRRAAKMVVLDLDHPDIEEFINWKVVEEQKVAALVAGSRAAQPPPQRHPQGVPRLAATPTRSSTRTQEPGPAQGDRRGAAARWSPANYIERVMQLAQQGFTSLKIEEYDTDWNSKAYYTVSGPEQQQLGAHRQRLHGGRRRRTAPGTCTGGRRRRRPRREGRPPKPKKTLQGPRAVGPDRLRGLGVRRPRRAVRHAPSTSGTPAPPTGGSTRSNPCVTGDTLVATADGLEAHRPAARRTDGGRRRSDGRLAPGSKPRVQHRRRSRSTACETEAGLRGEV